MMALGAISPTTGPAAVIVTPPTRGHEVYFQYVNEVLGGVGQKLPKEERYKITLHTHAAGARREGGGAADHGIEGKVLWIGREPGKADTNAMRPQMNEDKSLTAAGSLSSDWPKEKYLVATGAPYPAQFINAAQYLKDKGVSPKVGIIYQDDDYGLDGVKGLEFAAKEFGFQILARATYKTTDTAYAAPVTAMRAAGVDHVFLASTPSATGPIIGTAATLQYAPQWIRLSPAWVGALAGTADKPSPILPYLQQRFWVVTDAQCARGLVQARC